MREPPLILVADDDPDILELVAFALQRAGYETICARDGGEALELAVERLPNLAILDLMMPRVDGCEVTRQLRAIGSTAKMGIIILTAFAEEAQAVRALAAGADICLKKPFSPRGLADRVAALLTSRSREVAAEG